jgi:4-hydroxybenzoate polyprenyltransferase
MERAEVKKRIRNLIVVEGAEQALGWTSAVRSLWIELRPQQWLKNLLVLAPLLFSQNLFVGVAKERALIVFVLFCVISSSVYLLNDIQDRAQDRLHPIKRQRPLAAGHLSVGTAYVIMSGLFASAVLGGLILGHEVVIVLVCYWFINLLYSLYLKHHVILDVFALASGFVLRVVGGAVAIHVEMSHWLILCTTLLSLFLGFSKRRHEIVLLRAGAADHRQVLQEYSLPFLDMMIGVVTACTVMSYALYTVSEETVRKFQTHGLLLTVPFVLYGIFRYLYLIYHKDNGGDPAKDLFTDRDIVINLCLWAITTGIVIYWQ